MADYRTKHRPRLFNSEAVGPPPLRVAPAPLEETRLGLNETRMLLLEMIALSSLPAPNMLRPVALRRLVTGATKPMGWLADELTLQGRGLSGLLPLIPSFSYLNHSAWVTNSSGSEPQQFMSYYLNGLIPLSHQVDDAQLNALRERYVGYILDHQDAKTGWLGPPIPRNATGFPNGHCLPGAPMCHDYWSKYLMVEALESYAEAAAPQVAERVVEALLRHCGAFLAQLEAAAPPLNGSLWGFARYSDGIVGLQWLLDHVPTAKAPALWELMLRLRSEANAVMAKYEKTWEDFYVAGNPYKLPPGWGPGWYDWKNTNNGTGTVLSLRHGVDIGQAMKTGPLWWRVEGNQADFENAQIAVAWADRYLQMANGMFFADEEVIGTNSPARGTETCSVVEMMFSMRTAYEVTGNIGLMDRLEALAFNSLPAALWPDVRQPVSIPRPLSPCPCLASLHPPRSPKGRWIETSLRR
jgi:hypothetical protein